MARGGDSHETHPIAIRPESSSDADAIEALTADAFRDAPHSSGTEQYIVNALRRAGALTVSVVAERGGRIVGHVASSPVVISDGSPAWFGLGPVSVAPALQRRGIGTLLVEHALASLRARHASGCVVLGYPAYYGRFGFAAHPGLVLPGVPPQYFQALASGATVPAGTVAYHDAFNVTG